MLYLHFFHFVYEFIGFVESEKKLVELSFDVVVKFGRTEGNWIIYDIENKIHIPKTTDTTLLRRFVSEELLEAFVEISALLTYGFCLLIKNTSVVYRYHR